MTERGAAEDVRRRLVDAAIDGVRGLTPVDLVSAVGAREIARRAGTSPGTLFYHFGSLEAFAAAVVARVFDPGSMDLAATYELMDAVRSGAFPATNDLALHGEELTRLSSDPELRVRLGLWALGGEQVDDVYGRYLRALDAGVAAVFTVMLEAWDRELRPPFDVDSFVAIQVALLNGSSVRHAIDPERMTRDVFARAAGAIDMVAMRSVGDRHDMDDRLAQLNYFPPRRRSGARGRSRAKGGILDAAADLFGEHGYRRTTLAQIARRAGVGASTLHEVFPTKAALATELFCQQAADAVTDDGGAGDLRALLGVVAEVTAQHAGHATPYLAELACAPRDLDPLRREAAVLVARAGGDRDPVELADLLLVTVMRAALSRPGEGAGPAVDRACALLVVETSV